MAAALQLVTPMRGARWARDLEPVSTSGTLSYRCPQMSRPVHPRKRILGGGGPHPRAEARWTGRPSPGVLEGVVPREAAQRCPGPSGQGGVSALLWYERMRAGQAGTFRRVGGSM